MSLLSLNVETVCGANIKDVCKEAIELANKVGIDIKFEFNDRIVLVFPNADLDSLLLDYKDAQENNRDFVFGLKNKGT